MKKILVVDDEGVCTLYLSLALQDEGFQVESALKADQAIEIGTAFQPDYLITDWMLKDGKTGVDVARALKQINPQLHVVFITGMSKEMLDKQTEGLHYDAVLVKPVELTQILDILNAPPPQAANA